jgi:Sulfotransferase family
LSPAPTLEPDALIERSVDLAGLDDFGDVPFLEPLNVLVHSLVHDARVEGPTRDRAYEMLTGVLVKRLRLVADRKHHPEIEREEIDRPIFIVGPPRSGSTHLHALLACVGGLRAPLFWEMSAPSPPPDRATFDRDPRIALVQKVIDEMPEGLMVRHPMSATRPEQCNLLNDWSFINQAWTASFYIPSYLEWLLDADFGPAYEAHRRTLQHLQWQVPGRWVLKYPKHLLSTPALVNAYPDALFVWTHRDPAVVIPSAVSLTAFMRASNTQGFDPVGFGREWVVVEELALQRGIAGRDRGLYPSDRNTDVHFATLMAEPGSVVATICEQIGADFGDDSRQQVAAWTDSHPRTQHGVHRYNAGDFGLDPVRLRNRFAFYTSRFGVPAEASPR